MKSESRTKPQADRLSWRVSEWPKIDQELWRNATKRGDDIFDDMGAAAKLRPRTRSNYEWSYGRWICFLEETDKSALTQKPSERLTRERVTSFASTLSHTRQGQGSARACLQQIKFMLKLMYPEMDWSLVGKVANQKPFAGHRRSKPAIIVTSDMLVKLGYQLMAKADEAVAACALHQTLSLVAKETARDYRDGLLIAFAAFHPLRRANLAGLILGETLLKQNAVWSIELPDHAVKNSRAISDVVSGDLSKMIDRYIELYRPVFPAADAHHYLWASSKSVPLSADAIYQMFGRRTEEAFGCWINIHAVREAAANLWSLDAPTQMRCVRDLLGHADLRMTEMHYVRSQTRQAGLKLTEIVKQRIS